MRQIADFDELLKVFTYWVHEYHEMKPHYALGIYTPSEIRAGADKYETHTERMKKAAIDRREFNKNSGCKLKCKRE